MGKLRVHNIEAQTGTNVDLGAAGDVVTFASDSIQTNLYKDSGGNTIFQSNGSGTLSNVNTGLQGAGPKLITSTTVTSAVSTVEFTGITNTYSLYKFVFLNVAPSTNDQYFQAAGNVGGGFGPSTNVTSASYMAWKREDTWASGYGLAYRSSESVATHNGYFDIAGSVGNQSERSGSGIFWLYNPGSTTSTKNWLASFNSKQGDGTPYCLGNQAQGYFGTAAAVTGMSFKFASGNVASGKIKLYGII